MALASYVLQGLSALLSDRSASSSGQRLPRESQWGGPSDSWESEGSRGPTDESGGLQDVPMQLPVWLGWRDENDSEELFFASIHGQLGPPATGDAALRVHRSLRVHLLPPPVCLRRRPCSFRWQLLPRHRSGLRGLQ